MAAENLGSQTQNTHLLQELEALSQTLYQSHTTNRRANSLLLPRTSVPPITPDEVVLPTTIKPDEKLINPKPRQRRMSLSPWRSRPKLDDQNDDQNERSKAPQRQREVKKLSDTSTSSATSDKKGLWNWKPIRALSHIGMQKLSCLFSIEVVAVQGLPASMNGLRLSVCVRKKESRDSAVHTMPSRVSQGAADFEETMFIRCHIYCTSGGGTTGLKFEPRPFVIYVFAVDAEELNFGRSSVDLSHLIQESIEKNSEGTRIRQWDTSFNLSGKAKGGELVLKLGFQLMEKDGGVGIYNQAERQKSSKGKNLTSPTNFARKQSKASFSFASPRMSSRAEAWSPSQSEITADIQGMDELNLDEPAPVPSPSPPVQKPEEPESKMDDLELPEFDIVDKGVEIQDKTDRTDEEQSESDKRSVSSEVVKEVVHDQVHLTRLTELDSIAQQIKALESMMGNEKPVKTEEEEENASPRLEANEEMVTREFLQMLEGEEEADEFKLNQVDVSPLKADNDSTEVEESKVFISDLGKGLGCVVQTRNGGYLAAMNPLEIEMVRKDTPKLAMQISKPLVLRSNKLSSGFELFQRMAACGIEALSSEILSLMPMDELMGKTAEQIAFEGIASAIIQGRNKEVANSSAARTIAAVKTLAAAMSTGRKERISTGIWNVSENQVSADEILAFSMQKIEAMAVEALKIQAEMTEEYAPFDVYPVNGNSVLSSAVPLENWMKTSRIGESKTITISVVIQLRDPTRRYEAVGGPLIALINAKTSSDSVCDEEKRFKVTSLHIGGLRVRTREKRSVWDTEKQRLTAMQWLLAYGLGKAGRKVKQASSRDLDLLWSISSQVMADMWLKPMRNPDVKFNK